MNALLEARDVHKYFSFRGTFGHKPETVRAVNGVDLRINSGETLALVGESGSGKTTLGRCLLQMTQLTHGTVHYQGKDVSQLSRQEHAQFRRSMQIVFQDPFSSLNPRRSAVQQVLEPLTLLTDHPEPVEAAREALARVGIAGDEIYKYPRSFSGGQRQRIGIARALSVRPQFLMCDEPVSALDLSIQAQILQLLQDLQSEFGLTYLFISHDLSVVRQIATRVAVMYHGKIVELAPTEVLYSDARHPYTRQLLTAAPIADPQLARRQATIRRKISLPTIEISNQPLTSVGPGHLVVEV